jgi:creatinine amidohydrolase
VSFHGPTHYLVAPALRDFLDDTKTPAQYIDLTKVLFDDPSALEGENFYAVFLGAYDILGRLDDVPLTTPDHDYSQPSDSSLAFAAPLNALAPASAATGYYFGKPSDHGVTPKLETAADRQRMADAGVAIIDRMIEKVDVPEVIRLMEQLAAMQSEMDAEHLPGNYNNR